MSNVAEAIAKLTKVFTELPEKARTKNAPATAVFQDGLKFQVTGPAGEKVLTDMPPPMGGTGSGPNPGWLLRAALASCNATVIAMRSAIGAEGVTPAQLREIVNWSEAHSPVGCTIGQALSTTTEVEIV